MLEKNAQNIPSCIDVLCLSLWSMYFMKKKIVCVLVLLFGLVNGLVAQKGSYYYNSYFYDDYNYALADYKGTTAKIRAYDLYQKELARSTNSTYELVTKLSNFEVNLLWGAMNAYDYKAGEVYEVVMSINTDSVLIRKDLFLFGEIQKDGSFGNWYGIRYSYY